MMAAAACAALDYTLPRLSAVHAMTASAAQELETMGYKFALPVQTNMIVLDLEAVGIPGAASVGYCKDHEVAVFPNGRLVFHHQTSPDGVLRMLEAFGQLMSDKGAGAHLMDHEVTGGYA
jgi:threonine aldolase